MTHTQQRPWTTTLQEHKALREQVSRLRTFLSFGPGGEEDGEWARELAQQLSELAVSLAHHFENEEHSALFLTVPFEAPRFAHRIESLRGEHRSMMRSLGGIKERLRQPATDNLERLTENTLAFLEWVHQHEEIENDILQEVYQVDVAAAD